MEFQVIPPTSITLSVRD